MDNNKFKQSHDFSNIESNKHKNPGNHAESYNQQVTDYVNDMRSKKEEATREGFLKNAENAVPPDAWQDQQKAYNDAWENNKNQQLDDDV